MRAAPTIGLLGALAALVLGQPLTAARADDLADCNGGAPEKAEAACAAIINDAARSPDDRLKAYLGRSRLYLNTGKFDPALADANAALQQDAKSVPALLARGFAYHRTDKLDLRGPISIMPWNSNPAMPSHFFRAEIFVPSSATGRRRSAISTQRSQHARILRRPMSAAVALFRRADSSTRPWRI